MNSIAIVVQKLNGGGAERAAANLSLALSAYYQVHLIVFDGRDISYPYGGILHDLKTPPETNKLKKIGNVFRRTRATKTIKRENHIYASISLMDGANLVNVLSKTRDKTFPSIRIQMTKSEKRMNGPKLKASEVHLLRFVEKRCTRIVAVAEGVAEDLVKNCKVSRDKVTVIYNMCNGEVLLKKAALHTKAAEQMPPLSITTMGRLNDQKGQWHLIRAFSKVLDTVPEAHLFVFGNGPLEDRLKQLADEFKIQEKIHFMGFVESPHAFIKKSMVFVLPSLFEGMSNTILEAMNCGVPIIATDCESGSREILAPGTGLPHKMDGVEYEEYGILTAVGDKEHFNAKDELTNDEKQLAEAMEAILKDSSLRERYIERSLKRAEAFDFYAIGQQWCHLIEESY
jgi:glycosyltransferase involved in cell wall biosynthesis